MEQNTEQTTTTTTSTETDLLVSQLSTIKNSYTELQLTRSSGCSNQDIKDFSIGPKFIAFHLNNNDMIFFKNEEYFSPNFSMESISANNVRKNVLKISAASNDLIYLTASQQLHVIFNGTENSSNLREAALEFSKTRPIADFEVSYPHTVLLFSNNEVECLGMVQLSPEDLNSSLRIRKVEGLDNKTILSFCVGANNAYFVTENYKVFECDLNNANNEKYTVTPFEHLKNKVIKQLWCGKGSYFALEQDEVLPIDKWTQEEILEWAKVKGFGDFVNILRRENITGKDLLQADKDFLIDRLGLEIADLQVKFFNEVEKVSRKTYVKSRVFAWGNDSNGQLGLTLGQVTVTLPTEIKTLPELEKNDHIVQIECGTKSTVILTAKGRVWITEVPLKGDKKEAKPAGKWVDLTKQIQTLKDGRKYHIVKVSLSKDYFAALGAQKEGGDEAVSNKLKGADHICNRLLWDDSLNKDDFVVGYEDRFLGILEILFNEFRLKTDIPTHRIKYFKRKGEVVWDRATKVNLL